MRKIFLFCVISLCLTTVSTPNALAEKTFRNTNGSFLRADGYDYDKIQDDNPNGECVVCSL